MDMKEKLVELIINTPCVAVSSRTSAGCIADHLITNGVTVIPVKVGDTVYTNFAMRGWYFRDKDRPYSARVCFIGLNDSEEMGGGLFNVVYGRHNNMMQFSFSDIGKSVFLTKEEAEAHLPQPPKGD